MANNNDQEQITLTYDSIQHETKESYLISFDWEDEIEVWIPKSQSILNAHEETITVPLWLAVDKEIEMYEE